MIKASIIIPALNEENLIEATLKSITKQTIPRKIYEIIISDGKSSDNTLKLAKKYADKIISKKNKSISEARNLGAKKAEGDYLIFIDADTTVSPTLIETVIRGMRDESITGGFTKYRFKTKSLFIKLLNSLFLPLNYIMSLILPKFSIVAGICLIARRKVFNEVKGFNETMKTNEDNDLANRLRKKGRFVLLNEVVYTSDRRIKKMGFLGLLNYYIRDFLKHLINKNYKGDYIKVD